MRRRGRRPGPPSCRASRRAAPRSARGPAHRRRPRARSHPWWRRPRPPRRRRWAPTASTWASARCHRWTDPAAASDTRPSLRGEARRSRRGWARLYGGSSRWAELCQRWGSLPTAVRPRGHTFPSRSPGRAWRPGRRERMSEPRHDAELTGTCPNAERAGGATQQNETQERSCMRTAVAVLAVASVLVFTSMSARADEGSARERGRLGALADRRGACADACDVASCSRPAARDSQARDESADHVRRRGSQPL